MTTGSNFPSHDVPVVYAPASSTGFVERGPSRDHFGEREPLLQGSAQMEAIHRLIENVAGTDATIMLRGESGVGKDMLARSIHAKSPRRNGPFVKVNSAAIPVGLLESELFGHEKGAFTGAHRRKPGQFEVANNGTIFLDEIAELPLVLQAKLLHVLQDLRFSRVGGSELISTDSRVIAATNRDLEVAIARGTFREDLYYRLNVVEIQIPPLRERRSVIPLLAAEFLERFNEQYGRSKELSSSMMARLMDYAWPGNVRELENVMRRLVVLADGETDFEALIVRARNGHSAAAERPVATAIAGRVAGVNESLREIANRGAREAERQALSQVLDHVKWNRAEAARRLKVSYKTLLNKISEFELSAPSD